MDLMSLHQKIAAAPGGFSFLGHNGLGPVGQGTMI